MRKPLPQIGRVSGRPRLLVDDERTVIVIQLENEPGIKGSDRCYCPACTARFAAGAWEAQRGPRADQHRSVIAD